MSEHHRLFSRQVMYPRIECGGLQSGYVPNCKPWT
jgi:hypothetical protein